MSAGHKFFKGRYLHFITLQHMRCGILEVQPPTPPPHHRRSCAWLTLPLPQSSNFNFDFYFQIAFKSCKSAYFRWLSRTVLVKHTYSIYYRWTLGFKHQKEYVTHKHSQTGIEDVQEWLYSIKQSCRAYLGSKVIFCAWQLRKFALSTIYSSEILLF